MKNTTNRTTSRIWSWIGRLQTRWLNSCMLLRLILEFRRPSFHESLLAISVPLSPKKDNSNNARVTRMSCLRSEEKTALLSMPRLVKGVRSQLRVTITRYRRSLRQHRILVDTLRRLVRLRLRGGANLVLVDSLGTLGAARLKKVVGRSFLNTWVFFNREGHGENCFVSPNSQLMKVLRPLLRNQ